MEEDSKPSAALLSGEIAAPIVKMVPLALQQSRTISPHLTVVPLFPDKKRASDLFPLVDENKSTKSSFPRMDEKSSITTTSIENIRMQDTVATCLSTPSEALDQESCIERNVITEKEEVSLRFAV